MTWNSWTFEDIAAPLLTYRTVSSRGTGGRDGLIVMLTERSSMSVSTSWISCLQARVVTTDSLEDRLKLSLLSGMVGGKAPKKED